MTPRSFFLTAAAAAFMAGAAVSGPALGEAESQDPIKITLHDWTGQFITTQIMGEVLKKAGYNVEYVQADYLAQFAGPEDRRPDARHGDLGDHRPGGARRGASPAARSRTSARPAWWPRRSGGIPAYMKEKCPGLPNWEALKEPACAEAFSIAETAPKGRYLGGPVTWGGFDEERVEALGPAVRGGPCRHRRGAVRRAGERLPAPGADHALDLLAALGAGQIRGRVGRVPGLRGGLLHRPGLGLQSRRHP